MPDPSLPVERGFAIDAALVAASRAAPILVPLVFTPAVLGVFGRDIYALWAVLITTISILQNADVGVTMIMQRFHSHYRGLDNEEFARRLTTTVLLALTVIAVVLGLLGPFIAQAVVNLMELRGAVADDARTLLAPVGWIAGLELIGLALTGYLSGRSRFAAAAFSSLGARAGLAIVLILTLTQGWGVGGLVVASATDAVLAVLLAAAASWRHLVGSFRSVLPRSELREVWAFGWRSQLATAGFLVQRESDVVLATLLLPLSAVSAVAAGAQSSIAVSLFPTILLVPAVTRISHAAAVDRDQAIMMIERIGATWARFYPVYIAVVLGVMAAAVSAWIGPGLPESPLLATIIAGGMLAFLPGSVVALSARALGRPGIEASAYAALVSVKIVLGVAGALLFGAIGLAISTLLASIAGDVVLWKRGRSLGPALRISRPPLATLVAAVIALVVTAGGSMLLTHFVATPGLRLATLGVWAAVVFAGAALVLRRTSSSLL